MYAQLCKRLSEEAPDFERAGAPCTFRLLLLNKCRAEFENRALAFQQYEGRALAPDEEEKRHLAKCKMLGNIKFIGELGKLEILAESILHRCIQQLLARRAAADHHEDLECLAQLVRTCGRVLDSERGRGLMDQYFARIETLSASRDLAPRIRFMLRDVVELRRGGWVPRAANAASNEGPVPMHQLRDDDEPPPPSRRHNDRHDRDRHADRDRHHHDSHRGDRDPLFRTGLRSRPLDDVFAGLGLQPGSALVPPSDKLFGNGFASRDAHRQRSAPGGGGGGGGGGAGGGYFPRAQTNNNHYKHGSAAGGGGGGGGGAGGKDAGGRASKARVLPPAALHDVQMRPAANSLMFTANRISKPQPQPQLAPVQQSVLAPAFAAAPLLKEPAITIKQAPDKKDKPKKDKGPNKEEACRLALEAVAAVAREYPARAGARADAEADADADAEPDAEGRADADADTDADGDAHAHADADEDAEPRAEPLRRLLELQAPDKVLRRCITAVLEHTLARDASDAEVWAACRVLRSVKRAPLHEGARQALAAAAAAAAARGPAEGALPRLAARLVSARLLPLAEVAAWCEAGALHPLLLEVLRHLRAYTSLRHTQRLVHEAKIELCAYAVCAEGGEAAGLAALEARGLGALAPMLRVRAALARQLAAEPAPAALYRWIKAHVEPAVRASPAFVSALVALLAGHVTRAAGTDAPQPDKAALERERRLLEPYGPLLTALLRAEPALQLAAVYAAQLHAHHHRYPKGMLLRWFMHLYNMEVCEEDAFLRWREDVTDAYPGKGEALFQVNTWLTWLQQQESEEEEGED